MQAVAQVGYNWYAEDPFAFSLKRESRKRLAIITTIVFLLLCLLFFVYIAVKLNQPVAKVPEKAKIEVDIKSIPPPPTEARKQEKGVSEGRSMTAGEAQQTAAVAEQALASALQEATQSMLNDLSAGLPTASGGFGGSGGLLTGMEGGSLLDAGNAGLGGGIGSGTGLGTADVGGIIGGLGGVGGPGGVGIGGPSRLKGGGGVGQTGLGVKGSGNLVVGVQSRDMKVGSGGRSAYDIGAVVGKSQLAIQKCYEEARAIDGNFEGTIYLLVSILPTGNVKEVQVGKMSFKSDVLVRCVQKIFRRMLFTSITKSVIQKVQIPYDFKQGS